MEAVVINEDIRVAAAFSNRKVLPLWFLWRNRYYKVRSVNFAWSSNQGAAKLYHYAVTDGANTYELYFNARSLEWMLAKVCME